MTRRSQRPGLAAPIAAFAAILTALIPATSLLMPSWLLPAATGAFAVLAVGAVGRWLGAWAGIVGHVAVWAIATVWAFPGPFLGGLVPWGDAWLAPDVVLAANEQVLGGIAPVDVGPPLQFLLVSAVAFLAILVDTLAVATRLPLIAAIPLVAVFVTPQLAVPRGDHLALAVPFALALLALVAFAGRPRSRGRPRRRGSVGAIGLAVAAVLIALVVAPRVPVLPAADAGAFARPTSIDVSLDLGDDLRSRSTEEVLRVRTDQGPAPYLRLASHTRFDESGWQLDGGASRPLNEGFDEIASSGVVGDVESEHTRTWVSDVEVDTEYLPLPGDAVEVDGMRGEWNAMVESRTARSSSTSSKGERYRIDSYPRSPTRAQFDASPWASDAGIGGSFVNEATGERIREDVPSEALGVPDAVVDGPIGNAAREVTSEDRTPYETALGLQEWLRSSAFAYSLDTPVDAGFDGTDIAAVEQFLDARAGYCIHFATTYALMARSLGLPTRVAVGYLPGDMTSASVNDMTVYSVAANRLHAWPEVYLVGIGWTAFDPTPSVAQAQSIVIDTSGVDSDAPDEPSAPDAPEDETTEPSATPSDETEEAAASDSPSSANGAPAAWAIVLAALGAILLLAIPALVRATVRASRMRAARGGDVAAAWRELRAIAVDTGMSLTASDSPRVFGRRIAEAGAADEDVDVLVRAIEHRSFAAAGAPAEDLSPPLRRIARAIRADSLALRIRRAALPRSLWTRGPAAEVTRP